MTVLSTPARRRFIAAVCRSTCGEIDLALSVVQARRAALVCFVTSSAIASRLSGSAAAGWKQWVVRLAAPFLEPRAEHGDGVCGERRCSLFAPFPGGPHVRSGCELHVLAAQRGQLRHA